MNSFALLQSGFALYFYLELTWKFEESPFILIFFGQSVPCLVFFFPELEALPPIIAKSPEEDKDQDLISETEGDKCRRSRDRMRPSN